MRDLESKRAYDREYQRRRYAANPEREIERSRQRALADPEGKRERERRWRELNRDKIRARYAERFRWLDAYRRVHGCVDCGTTEGVLHLDHRDDEITLFKPSAGVTLSWGRLEAEVAKCDVRCASCHQKRHAAKRAQRTEEN